MWLTVSPGKATVGAVSCDSQSGDLDVSANMAAGNQGPASAGEHKTPSRRHTDGNGFFLARNITADLKCLAACLVFVFLTPPCYFPLALTENRCFLKLKEFVKCSIQAVVALQRFTPESVRVRVHLIHKDFQGFTACSSTLYLAEYEKQLF